MVIPKPIYEIIPILYVVTGIITITSTDGFIALSSGLLLTIAGLLILVIRRNYRAARKAYMLYIAEPTNAAP
ncbi:MAG: hypothetical protein HKM94_00735 [Halobacteria archaeon]|nr:hypothetical protein [Halobacteria archaeon]